MVPLQMGIPGGPELLVILLILLLLFGIPLALLGVGGFLYLRSNASDETQERITELEAEIDHLRGELDANTGDGEQTPDDGGNEPETPDDARSDV